MNVELTSMLWGGISGAAVVRREATMGGSDILALILSLILLLRFADRFCSYIFTIQREGNIINFMNYIFL